MKPGLRTYLRSILENQESRAAKVFELLLLCVNLFACAAFVAGTYFAEEPAWMRGLEIVIVSLFIIEYCVRAYVAKKPLRYIFSMYGLIDLISILPSFVGGGGFGFVRGLRVLRILRFIRYLESENFFFGRISRLKLQAARTLFTIFTVLFVAAGFILVAETSVRNAAITTFDESFYYCVVTLATVGFGDMVPVTLTGRWITIAMILTGMILVPWQAGRLLRELLRGEREKQSIICRGCGLNTHDYDAVHCKACGTLIFHEHGDFSE